MPNYPCCKHCLPLSNCPTPDNHIVECKDCFPVRLYGGAAKDKDLKREDYYHDPRDE